MSAISAAGPLGGHALHAIPLLIPVVAIGAVMLPDLLRARWRRLLVSAPGDRRLLLVTGLATLTAAGVHFSVTREHFDESVLYGVFFLVTGLFQSAYAGYLMIGPNRRMVWAGVVSNAGLLGLWLITRTAGIPLGPGRGTVEAIGVPDLIAVAAELVAVTAAVLVLLPAREPIRSVGLGAPAPVQ